MAPRLFHLVSGDVRRVDKCGHDIERHEWLTAKELGPKLDKYRRIAREHPCFWFELRND